MLKKVVLARYAAPENRVRVKASRRPSAQSRGPVPLHITACPRSWYQETVDHPELAARLKAVQGQVEDCCPPSRTVCVCTLEMSVVYYRRDTVRRELRICASATHIVILAGNDPKTGECWEDRMSEWRRIAQISAHRGGGNLFRLRRCGGCCPWRQPGRHPERQCSPPRKG